MDSGDALGREIGGDVGSDIGGYLGAKVGETGLGEKGGRVAGEWAGGEIEDGIEHVISNDL